MAAILASPTTSSRTSSRRRRRSNPTRTVTAIRPSLLTSPTAGMLLSKVTMYVMMGVVSNIHEIDILSILSRLRRRGTTSTRPLGNQCKEDQVCLPFPNPEPYCQQ